MPTFKPIQLIPPGLLGLFQLKQGGRGLVELPDILQGTLELRDWYLQARSEQWRIVSSIAIAATGRDFFQEFSPNSIQVPSREWWYVWDYTVTAIAQNAGDTIHAIHPSWVDVFVGTQFPNALAPSIGPAAGLTSMLATHASGFFLPAGATLGFGYSLTVAGLVDFSGHVRFTRLPV